MKFLLTLKTINKHQNTNIHMLKILDNDLQNIIDQIKYSENNLRNRFAIKAILNNDEFKSYSILPSVLNDIIMEYAAEIIDMYIEIFHESNISYNINVLCKPANIQFSVYMLNNEVTSIISENLNYITPLYMEFILKMNHRSNNLYTHCLEITKHEKIGMYLWIIMNSAQQKGCYDELSVLCSLYKLLKK